MISRKKVLSILIATNMVVSSTLTASASGYETTISGRIEATQIKFTVPAVIPFTIDPTIDLTKLPEGLKEIDASIIQSDKFIITNKSQVKMNAYITDISISQTNSTDDVVLINDPGNLTELKSMMFTVSEADNDTWVDFNDQNAWLMKGKNMQSGENGFLLSKSGSIELTDEVNSSRKFKICGQTKNGWTPGDTFTISPTIIVVPTT